MDLGGTIKNIRKQRGIRQNALAEQCNISQTYLSQIESNIKEPNLSTLKKIAETLKISLPILFFLSLDDKDIPENKKQVYSIISPTIKTLISELLNG